MKALEQANQIRSKRAQLKRDLKAGRAQIERLIARPPAYVQTARIADLLLAVPKYGRVKAHKVLTHASIPPSKTIGDLSDRQRRELLSQLRR